MGMPVDIEIIGPEPETVFEEAFHILQAIDERFSTYKTESEITKINQGVLALADSSNDMREVFELAEKTKKETEGYFDIRRPDGTLDPSGIVKGWAIHKVAEYIRTAGYSNFFINAGGDIALSGTNVEGNAWRVGIQNPFNTKEIVKVVYPYGKGIATSGSYVRGAHIYNPHAPDVAITDIVSLTVIGPNVLEADRYATGAFAMGKRGIAFLEHVPGFEGYMIDAQGIATMTSGFSTYTPT